jgi:hypothetical protein
MPPPPPTAAAAATGAVPRGLSPVQGPAGVSGCAAGLLAAMAWAGHRPGRYEIGGSEGLGGATAGRQLAGRSGAGGLWWRRGEALQQQLRQLLGALVRLGEYEGALRRAVEVQWADFRRTSQVRSGRDAA